MRVLRWALASLLALIAVFTFVASIVGLVENALAHEEDGGRARVHSPFLAKPCSSDTDPECVAKDPTVKFDLRGDDSDEVADKRLYDRARRYGPFFVDVKWRSDSHEVTQVREDGRWRVVAHPAAGDAVFALLAIGAAVVLLFFALAVAPITVTEE